jgi:hypothetical protein
MTTEPKPSVHVRLPRDLIAKLHRLADEQGITLNAYLLLLIAGAAGWTLDDDNKEAPRRANVRGRDRIRRTPDAARRR